MYYYLIKSQVHESLFSHPNEYKRNSLLSLKMKLLELRPAATSKRSHRALSDLHDVVTLTYLLHGEFKSRSVGRYPK